MPSGVGHGKWGDPRYTGKNCRDPRTCSGNTQGSHLQFHCGVQHKGLEDGEACKAVLVFCSVHRNKLYRDLEQEEKILSAR